MAVSREAHSADACSHEELFDRFLDRLPKEFIYERQLLKARVWRSQEVWEYWKENP